MGTFAVQIAKASGAQVTAVGARRKLGALLSVGADNVIDYEDQDFSVNGQTYDLILDVAAHRSMAA